MNIKRIIFVFFIVGVAISNVFCQSTAKYTTTSLNLRQSPNTASKVIIAIPKGTAVTIDEDCDCKWILVSYQNQIGYVYAKYLTKKKVEQILPSSAVKYYTNSYGKKVQSPTYYTSAPKGATALCRDGSYSFSRNRRGTCSRHGGVAKWY